MHQPYVETLEGTFWVPPRFGDSVTPRQNSFEIRLPYWTSGKHCLLLHTSGRFLSLEEIERYLEKKARQWAESYER